MGMPPVHCLLGVCSPPHRRATRVATEDLEIPRTDAPSRLGDPILVLLILLAEIMCLSLSLLQQLQTATTLPPTSLKAACRNPASISLCPRQLAQHRTPIQTTAARRPPSRWPPKTGASLQQHHMSQQTVTLALSLCFAPPR